MYGGTPSRRLATRWWEVHSRKAGAWRTSLGGVDLQPERGHEARELRLLDSVDHRLARAGVELVASGEEPHVVCSLTRAGDDAAAPSHELERLPRFVWDLPRDQALGLAGVLEARTLQPIGTHEIRIRRWAVRDDQRKTVAWLEEERHRVRPVEPGSRAVRAHRLVLRGLRGYEHELEQLARRIGTAEGLVENERTGFDPRASLRVAPRRPGRWRALAPGVTAGEALARIARSQVEALEANAAGLRADLDAEYLHDSRIALRRLRSLLGQLEGILTPEDGDWLAAELRWLAARTGTARDLDALLFDLRLAEPDQRAALQPALELLEQERRGLQTALVEVLDSLRCAALLERLHAVFAERGTLPRPGPRAGKPFARLLAKRLRRRLRQVLTKAEQVSEASPAAELHELRITCKKLRYLLECCRGLVPKHALSSCTEVLKGLQRMLGTIQDTVVQGARVRELAEREGQRLPASAVLALGRYLERLEERAREARQGYAGLSRALTASDGRGRFESLLEALEGSRS